MAREPEKVNSACLPPNRVEIARQLHPDSEMLLLDRERQKKCTVDRVRKVNIPDLQTLARSDVVSCKTQSCRLQVENVMRPDRVEVSWDVAKSKWLVRIETGEEVIRRHCDVPKNADDQTLRLAVRKP